MTVQSGRHRKARLPLRLGRSGVALAFFAACWASPVSAQPQTAPQRTQSPFPKPAQIDRNGVLILIRSTLLAVHHANVTGNYSVLRELGAPGFKEANTTARLAEIFANLRAKNMDLSGLAVLEPQLTLLPQIEATGLMRMAGFFPSVPLQVNFELLFAPVAGKWRLFGVSMNIGDASPAAPAPAPEPRETAKPEPKPKPEPKASPKSRPLPPPVTLIPPTR